MSRYANFILSQVLALKMTGYLIPERQPAELEIFQNWWDRL